MGQVVNALMMIFLLVAGTGGAPRGREVESIVPRVELLRELSGRSDSPLLCLHGLASLPDGGFLVTDRLDYRVKMFGVDGTLLRKVGGRGTGLGRFLAPGPIDYSSGGIVVAEFAGSTVQLYSRLLEPEILFQTPGTVSDIRCDRRSGVWAVLLPQKGPAVLAKYNRRGEEVLIRTPRHATGNLFADACHLDLGENGSLVISYLLRNVVEVWDTSGRWLRDLAVPGLPAETAYRTLGTKTSPEGAAVPEGVLFRSASVDRAGRLYLLGGDFSARPGRDIYLFDAAGRYAGLLTLPREAVVIRRGKGGQLWVVARGRTSVIEYRLLWDKRHAG